MSIKSRVQKLEGSHFKHTGKPGLFVKIMDTSDQGYEYQFAYTSIGNFQRNSDESEGKFLVRVFRSLLGPNPFENIPGKDPEILAAALDEEAAFAMAEHGSVPDEVLNNVIKRIEETIERLEEELEQ